MKVACFFLFSRVFLFSVEVFGVYFNFSPTLSLSVITVVYLFLLVLLCDVLSVHPNKLQMKFDRVNDFRRKKRRDKLTVQVWYVPAQSARFEGFSERACTYLSVEG